MTFLTGVAKSQASQQTAVSGLRLQSSAYGKVIPIVYGTTRLAPNLIWYGDFVATPQQSSAGAGGKGGGIGGGGSGKAGSSSTYIYQTAVALGLCEGPIQGIGNAYVDKNVSTIAALGLSTFFGAYAQAAWGYLTTNHSDEALGYSGIAYLAASAYQLGNSAQLPNHNFEIQGIYSNSVTGVVDADPSLVIADLLTNVVYGSGFPLARLGDLSIYQSYTLANGLWISPAYAEQTQASSLFDDLAIATNSAFVWSGGVLTLVPYGDTGISANGYTYTPPSVPIYDLTDDDFLPAAGTTQNPILLSRMRPSDALNSIKIECLDRGNGYNTALIEAKDQALIETFGLRQSSSKQTHLFCDTVAARMSAQLQLQRHSVRNTYQFTLDQRYVLLDPMDIVTLTDAYLGLNKQWVRITEITENDDASLSITAEEYLNGSGSAPLYSFQSGRGFSANYNTSPGNANTPVVFEPTAFLCNGLEVWFAASGGINWGGCDVYISNDGNSYKNIGRITGSCRTGVLTAPLGAVTQAATGQTIDTLSTLCVNLRECAGQLLSGSQADATSLTTLCYVDGEYIAYQSALLVAENAYHLTYLVRGAYGTKPGAHAIGAQFARLDGGILKFNFTPDYVGTTIYIKLVSFNIYGGGQQTLMDVQPYAYTIVGTALASPLADIPNLRTSYNADLTQLSWDAAEDFRPVLYEIRKGASWTGAQVLGRVAYPPFATQGNGTYWVSAYSQPAAGLQVYSETPGSVSVTGAQITTNVIASYDEAITSWSGTLAGTAVIVGSTVIISGIGDILADPDYLGTPDIFYYGGVGDGTYEIPTGHQIDVGRIIPCSLIITWVSRGQNITDNILATSDYLDFADVLDYVSSANVNVYPEIALSQDGTTWSAWQKYVSGSYVARKFKARMQLLTYDPSVEAILEDFTFAVDVPDRNDHYVGSVYPRAG